jgi:hypothetical protein
MYLLNFFFWCSLFHFLFPPFHLLKVINLIYTFEFFQFFTWIFWETLFHFLTFRIIFCSYLRGGYHMYLFNVKVKLITKQTYYVSGVRLYNKGKILVVHYVIWLLPCKGVGGIWVRWKGHMNTITNYRADSSFQQSCSAGPSNASRCRKLESTRGSNVYYLPTPSFVLEK